MADKTRRDEQAGDGQAGPDPTRLFAPLRDRETPALDEQQLWRRLHRTIEAERPSRAAWLQGWRVGLAPRWRPLSAAAAVVIFVAVAWFAGVPGMSGSGVATEPLTTAQPAGELVLLAPPLLVEVSGAEPKAAPRDAATTGAGEGWLLDVRLVRGFDGAAPDDALPPDELAGTGGASRFGDVRSSLELLLPFDDFAVVGLWSGPLAGSQVELSPSYRLGYDVGVAGEGGEENGGAAAHRVEDAIQPAPEAFGTVSLSGVRLLGSGQVHVASELALQPGQLYLLGVPDVAGPPSLVLAIRLTPADEG